MNDRPVLVVLFGVAIVGLTVAIWAGPNDAVAGPAAGLAVVAAVVAAGVAFWPRTRLATSLGYVAPSGDPWAGLWEGFRGDSLGRQTISSTIQQLNVGLPRARGAPSPLDEERELMQLDRRAFLDWVEAEIARLERET